MTNLGSEKRTEMALEFAERTVRQTMTLTAGILALSAVFADELASTSASSGHLVWAWGLYGASFAAGLLVLQGLTGYLAGVPSGLAPGEEVPITHDLVDSKWIAWPGRFQLLTFVLGTVSLVVAALRQFTPDADLDESLLLTVLVIIAFALGLFVRSLTGWVLGGGRASPPVRRNTGSDIGGAEGPDAISSDDPPLD